MYTVRGASIPQSETEYDFPFKPRDFQSEFLDWLYSKSRENIVSVEAPTGSGKTATFRELIKKRGQVLLVYPTNALIREQRQTLEAQDIEIKELTSDALDRTGIERRDELMGHVRRGSQDAIITNPDIIQAIVQDQYVDFNSKLMRFFEYFDAIVYDEYHFYDDFSASGIMLQTKIAIERNNADIVFASATGNNIPDLIQNSFDFDVRKIKSEVMETEKASQFRYQMEIRTSTDGMLESKENICDKLTQFINDKKDEEMAVLIFNSAKDSNEFYNYLQENRTNLYYRTEKDNGYDTKTNYQVEPSSEDILVTTSKGEVGLDYNITRLFMENPYSSSSFLQRIGRCARRQNSECYVYSIGGLPWDEELGYQVFVENVYESIRDERLTEEKITNLMGLRSAYSVKKRMNDGNYNEEILEDFTDTPKFNKWKLFVDKVSEEYDTDYGIRVPSGNFTQLLKVLYASLDCLNTLRGKSVNIEVKYPRGHEKVTTEYSLLSVLIQYNCRLEDGAIVVDESGVSDSLIEVTGLKGNQNVSTYNDLNSIVDSYEDMLDSAESELEDRMNLLPSLVKEYFRLICSRNAVIIERLKLGDESITL